MAPSVGNVYYVNPDFLHATLQTYSSDLGLGWQVEAIAHALLDAGRPFECEWPECILPSRAFGAGRSKLTLDHVVRRSEGGGHHLGNLRLAHAACNYGWARGMTRTLSDAHLAAIRNRRRDYVPTPEHRANIGAAHRGRKATPEALVNMRAAAANRVPRSCPKCGREMAPAPLGRHMKVCINGEPYHLKPPAGRPPRKHLPPQLSGTDGTDTSVA